MNQHGTRQVIEKKLYSIAEVLELTGLGRTKLFELLSDHSIESVRVGTRRLIPAHAIDEWIENLRVSEVSSGI